MTTKINKVLQALPSGGVATQTWLTGHGVDARLADKYVRSGWFSRVGHGAYSRVGQSVDWPGALWALQQQGRSIYPGGPSVMELRGYSHYVPAGSPRALILFGPPQTKLPSWFLKSSWSRTVRYVTPRLFDPDDQAPDTTTVDGLPLQLPGLERAALETMWMVPKRLSYEEAVQLLESLTILRPEVVQHYLSLCRSVQTKRLLLHSAMQLGLPWYNKMDLSEVTLGSGPRTIHPGGQLQKKYNLVIDEQEIR